MQSCLRRILTILLSTLALASGASAQITPAEIGETGFFGPGVTLMFEQQFPSLTEQYDKNNPLRFPMPMGMMYGFFHKGDPYLVIAGNSKIDFGEAVALPSDGLVLKDFIWIYSRKDITLQVSDFPAELSEKLATFWTGPAVTLYEKGSVLRAAPTGDVLDGVRGFLMLDNLSGTTVLAFAKNKTIKVTQLMLNGTITNPFGMEMVLTNPVISYTKKTKVPGTVMGLASTIDIKKHAYEFQAEGDVKLRKPEIFVLKTASMTPQDVINVTAALTKPLFPSVVGTMPPWNLGGIPTFQLRPPKTASPNFPAEDQSKVVVYAAIADKPEWGIKGPALKIRGNLAIETKPAQDIAVAELVADASALNAAFGLPSFTLPGSDISFGTASAQITAASTTWMGISATTAGRCFQQRFSFKVGTSGIPEVDLNATQTLKALTPDGFVNNFQNCMADAEATGKYILKVGTTLLGYGESLLFDSALPAFIRYNPALGAEQITIAAKAVGYAAATVGTGLAKVLDNTGVLTIGDKAYGALELGKIATAAKIGTDDILRFGIDVKHSYQYAGTVLSRAGLNQSQVLDAASKIYPQADLAVFGQSLGANAEQMMSWANTKALNPAAIGGMFKNAYFDRSDVLTAANKVLKPEQIAGVAKAALYSADNIAKWAFDTKKSAEFVGSVIGTTEYLKDDLLDAGKKYFGNESVAAIGKAAGYGAEDIYHWTFARHMGPADAGKLVAGAFHKDYVLGSGKKVFDLGNEGVAELGKAVGYSATDMSHWYYMVGVGQKDVAKALRAGGYVKDEVTSGLQTVYGVGKGTAEDLWNDAVKGAGKIGGYLDPRNWW